MQLGSTCQVTPVIVKRKILLFQCNKCLVYLRKFILYFSLPFFVVYPFATLLIGLVLVAFIYWMWKRQNGKNEGMVYVIIKM